MSLRLIAVLATALCAVLATADTTGESVYGYGPYTMDVTSYYNFTADVRDVQTATNSSAPNFKTVQDIYNNGRNALSRAGTPRPTKAATERPFTGETFYDLQAVYHKDPIWLGTILGSAVNGTASPFNASAADYCCGSRIETIRGGYRAFLAAFAMHEIDAGFNARENATAATRAIDEGVALWYGRELSNTSNSLHGSANSRAHRGCTDNSTNAGSIANDDFYAAAQALRTAIAAGNEAGAVAARNDIYNAFASVFLQAVLYNGNEAAVTPAGYLSITAPCITKCGIRRAKQAGALVYWRAVAPIIAKAAPQDASAITAALLPTSPLLEPAVWQGLKAKLEAAADKAGISCSAKVDACPPPIADAPLGAAAGRRLRALAV